MYCLQRQQQQQQQPQQNIVSPRCGDGVTIFGCVWLCPFFVNCGRLPCQKISKVLFSCSAGITIVWILLQNVSKCYNGNGKNNNVLIIRLIKFIFVFTATFLTFRMIDVLDPDGLLWRKYRLNS